MCSMSTATLSHQHNIYVSRKNPSHPIPNPIHPIPVPALALILIPVLILTVGAAEADFALYPCDAGALVQGLHL